MASPHHVRIFNIVFVYYGYVQVVSFLLFLFVKKNTWYWVLDAVLQTVIVNEIHESMSILFIYVLKVSVLEVLLRLVSARVLLVSNVLVSMVWSRCLVA